jgi:hypothetical protein
MMINGQYSFVPSAQAIRKKMKENESSPQSAISEKEMAVLGPKKVLFPDKHSRELPGSSCFEAWQFGEPPADSLTILCHPQ